MTAPFGGKKPVAKKAAAKKRLPGGGTAVPTTATATTPPGQPAAPGTDPVPAQKVTPTGEPIPETELKPAAEAPLEDVEVDDLRSIEYITRAETQIQEFRPRGELLDRAIKGEPALTDFYLSPEGVVVMEPIIRKSKYRLPHVILNGIVGDMRIDSITGWDDGSTAAIARVLNRLRANIKLWPLAEHIKARYAQAWIDYWTNPETGATDAWVLSPLECASIVEAGEELARVRVWDVKGRPGRNEKAYRRANVKYTTHMEKWIRPAGGTWAHFEDEDYEEERVSIYTPEEIEGLTAVLSEAELDVELAKTKVIQGAPIWPLVYPDELRRKNRIPGAWLRTSLYEPEAVHEAGISFWLDGAKGWYEYRLAMETQATPWYAEKVEQDRLRQEARAELINGRPPATLAMPQTADALDDRLARLAEGSKNLLRRGGVYQFAGDLTEMSGSDGAALNTYHRETLMNVCRVTNYPAMDIDPSIHSSGVERRENRYRYIQMIEGFRLLDGAEIEDLVEDLLLLGEGIEIPEGESINLNWTDSNRLDPTELWLVVAQKIAAGVAADTALQEAGYTASETEQFQAKKDAAFAQAQAGTAQPGLGTAVGADKKQADLQNAAADAQQAAQTAQAKAKALQ